jgi:O-antigen/teichoic acid export membrane protein
LSLSAIFIALGPEIATGLFWEKFVFSGKLLSIAWIFLCFHLLTSFNYKILAWLGKVKQRVFITGTSCIITIIIAYIGIKLWWLYWASIAFGISNMCNWVLSLWLIKKYGYNYDIKWKFIIKNCILFIILWTIIYLWKSLLPDLITSRFGIIIYLICTWLLFYWVFWLCNIKTIKNFIKVKNHL